MLIVIALVRALHMSNLVLPSMSPIFQVVYYFIGQIFVDDIDINIRNNGKESTTQIVSRA